MAVPAASPLPVLAPARPRPRARAVLPLVAALVAASLAGPAGAVPTAVAATYGQLIGQKLVVAMDGTTPSSDLLGRIERGEVGGVILFGDNITSPAGLVSVTRTLQAAATRGGQPRLLISTDQEGGSIRRVPWAPPTMSVPAIGATGSTATATSQGKATGRALGCAGVNVNLAPVADVPSSTSSFMYLQGRTWSFDPAVTAALSDAFAAGHVAGGSAPTMKHFPGIGMATRNTDDAVVTITASKSALDPGLDPYRKAIAHHIPLIMLSNATYTAYDSANAAGWSNAIAVGLLRTTLGFTGVSITDSLNGTASARGVTATSLAIKAAAAGTDMLLLTGSEASTKAAFSSLLSAASSGSIPLARLQASYDRILALKHALPAPPADAGGPVMTAPVSTLAAGTTLGTTTVPVRTAWSASDPCLVAAYALTRRENGGAWTAQSTGGYWTRSIVQGIPPATTLRYAAKATDNGARWSAWAYGATVEPFVRQETGGIVKLAGTWGSATTTTYSGGTTAWSATAGSTATYTFSGTSVAWVTAFGPTRGSAEVWVDGTKRATVSTYSPTVSLRRLAYAVSWPGQAQHTIRIVVLGTAGHPRVDVDAFARLWRP